ncbi:hypothetical protein A0H81_14669 [Grifola frondosa]|uniref:Uncharacterized protein n=1 Tax=Grifola frondosa TaxID=5627 RepID=A0A1C7LKP9_GRIFR|nr:hypothetical protein A0H81_14669 [Grifola frondosa]
MEELHGLQAQLNVGKAAPILNEFFWVLPSRSHLMIQWEPGMVESHVLCFEDWPGEECNRPEYVSDRIRICRQMMAWTQSEMIALSGVKRETCKLRRCMMECTAVGAFNEVELLVAWRPEVEEELPDGEELRNGVAEYSHWLYVVLYQDTPLPGN